MMDGAAVVSVAPILSLADLENHDPGARRGPRERRFLCPLSACAGHQRPGEHRSLSANADTGAWRCHRCGASGLLREHWTERTQPQERPASARSRDQARRRFQRRAVALAPPPALPPPDRGEWRRHLDDLRPLAGSPGMAYLAGRGIGCELADAAGVRFAPGWYGRPAVVFPLRGPDGALRAAQGRCLQDRANRPNKLSAGPIGQGVFAAPGALARLLDKRLPVEARPPIILTEAPIDALSLAAAGFPALALCGKDLGALRLAWLRPLLAWRDVLLAFDADAAGDEAAAQIDPLLLPVGARPRRLRPSNSAKDWNALLVAGGAAVVAACVGRQWPGEAFNGKERPDASLKALASVCGPLEGAHGAEPRPVVDGNTLTLAEWQERFAPWVLSELGRLGASDGVIADFAEMWELDL